MQTQHIALVPEAGGLSSSELLRVSAALQRQVSSQFGPIWELHGTVDAFAEIEDVPAGYWPIVLSPQDRAGVAAGIHLDQNGQPYARVKLAPGWSLDASRVCLEMLANPFGRRTLNAQSPRSDQGPAEVLLEVCGAFGDVARAYVVNDVAVADFCTPAFFDAPARRANERYSYRGGSFGAPMQLLRGGHLAWFDAISNSWWLRSFHDEHPSDLSLGTMRLRAESVRELVLRHEPERPLSLLRQESLDERVGLSWLGEQGSAASRARAERLRALLVGTGAEADRIVVDVPAALRVEAREQHDDAQRSRPMARFAAKATRHEAAISAAEEIEQELRAVVAAEIDAAVEAREQHMDAVSEPVAPVLAPEPVRAHARAVQRATEPAPPPALPEPKQPSAAAPAQPTASPQLPKRPSSIAPIAMLDSAARPPESRIGMILTAAAVGALALAVFARSSGPRPADVPPPAAAVLRTAPAVSHAAQSPAPAQETPASAQVSAPSAPGARPAAQKKTESALPSAREKRDKTPVEPAAAKAGAREAEQQRDEAIERRREARALAREQELAKSNDAQPASRSAPREVPPAAEIEGLFDTRR